VADPGDGVDWVSLARNSSAAQLEKVARGVRRAEAVDEAAADPELAEWKVRTRKRYDRDGNLVITITTRAEYAPIVEAGLEAKRAELQRQLDAQDEDDVPQEPPVADADRFRCPTFPRERRPLRRRSTTTPTLRRPAGRRARPVARSPTPALPRSPAGLVQHRIRSTRGAPRRRRPSRRLAT
jgi:hypothetical protein